MREWEVVLIWGVGTWMYHDTSSKMNGQAIDG
jgi:hypothetical protein